MKRRKLNMELLRIIAMRMTKGLPSLRIYGINLFTQMTVI